jgi:hypothetical protein
LPTGRMLTLSDQTSNLIRRQAVTSHMDVQNSWMVRHESRLKEWVVTLAEQIRSMPNALVLW